MAALEERLRKLAEDLCLTPTNKIRIEKGLGKWWLVGCVEGDQPLPQVHFGQKNAYDALRRAEEWLRAGPTTQETSNDKNNR